MPELPEVQTVVDDLNTAGLTACAIRSATVRWPGVLADATPPIFRRTVTRRRIQRIRRRAKYIVWELEGNASLLIHLRMTGRLYFAPRGSRYHPHEHLALNLDDGRQLRYHDTRKFGRFYLPADPETILGRLGPEPLESGFTGRCLAGRLKAHRRALKPLLLDQHFIAGLGNIYVDEALWEAGLHPLRSSASLAPEEIRRLHGAIRRVLRRGLRNLGTTLGTGETTFYSVARRRGRNRDALKVFRRTGAPCPRCGQAVEHSVVAQRSTHICPHCQH
jgi:formamidopyrimidine-DNA glycosylase